MAKTLLVTNPSCDEATEYLDSWSVGIIEAAKKQKDTLVLELRKQDVSKENLTKLIDEHKPKLVLFHGHGGEAHIQGFEYNILIKCGDNEHLLKDKIIHSLACDSGKKLGPDCIRIGTMAYLGYKEEFKFAHLNKTGQQEQSQDVIAELFLNPAFETVRALITGRTAEQAHSQSQKMYLQNLSKVLTNQSPQALNIAALIYHDLTHQVCLGDKAAYF